MNKNYNEISSTLPQQTESFSISIQNWFMIAVFVGIFLIFPLIFIWSSLGIIRTTSNPAYHESRVLKAPTALDVKKNMVQKERFAKKA